MEIKKNGMIYLMSGGFDFREMSEMQSRNQSTL